MNKRRKTIIYIVIIALASIYISIIMMRLVKDPQTYIDEVNSKHLPIIFSYILLSITQTIIPIIPGEPVELLGGYLFGNINGSILCFTCETISSIFIVLISKKYGKRIINYFIDGKKIETIEKFRSKKTFNLFALLFIMPGTPKDLLCYFSGLTEYDLVPLLIVVSIGRIPSILSSTLTAGFFQDEKYIISIIIYAITVLVCAIDIIIYNRIIKKNIK